MKVPVQQNKYLNAIQFGRDISADSDQASMNSKNTFTRLSCLALPDTFPRNKTTEVRKATWDPLTSLLQARYLSNRTLKLTALRFVGCQALCQSITSSFCVVLSTAKKFMSLSPSTFFFPLTDKEIEAQRESVTCRRSNRYTEMKLGLESILSNSRACTLLLMTHCRTAIPWGMPRKDSEGKVWLW